MTIELKGKTTALTETGFLVNLDDWTEELAQELAKRDGIELKERHWDAINYLRDQYFEHGGLLPNVRTMAKDLQRAWPDEKVNASTLFDLFPGNPSKQAGQIAGLPESMRKGGY